MVRTEPYASFQRAYMSPLASIEKCSVPSFLEREPRLRDLTTSLSKATVELKDCSNQFQGNGVAIAKDLVLTSAHCIETGTPLVRINESGETQEAEVFFDGSQFGLDFKILKIPGGNLSSISLSVTPNTGDFLQLYYEGSVQNVKISQSDFCGYATRSDFGSSRTTYGESGAPRISLSTGAVYAIHQGDKEALKFNDVYLLLEAQEKSGNAQAREVLQNIHLIDREMAYLHSSTIVLNVGDVREEKARVKGSLTVGNRTFAYHEIGQQKGNRSIRVFEKGTNNDATYLISPNPHSVKRYNKGKQPEFYQSLANSLAKALVSSEEFPKARTINIFKTDFTVTKE